MRAHSDAPAAPFRLVFARDRRVDERRRVDDVLFFFAGGFLVVVATGGLRQWVRAAAQGYPPTALELHHADFGRAGWPARLGAVGGASPVLAAWVPARTAASLFRLTDLPTASVAADLDA